ncbi:MAG: hypothetical protein K0R54_586 [Clostridiaceae bacterium]|jgi:hypothetical protein|nr:hypothetical protein [Clostridiaceae bacterium]
MSEKFTIFEVIAKNKIWSEANKEKSLKSEDSSVELALRTSENFDNFEDNMAYRRLFGLPKNNNYHKTFLECLCNAICDLSNALSKDIMHFEDYLIGTGKTKDGLNIEFRHMFSQFGQVLRYIVNCTSWRTGNFEPFDAFEISKKLSYVISFCKREIYKESISSLKENTMPSFEFISAGKIKINEKPFLINTNLGEGINSIINSNLTKNRFFYTVTANTYLFFNYNQLL